MRSSPECATFITLHKAGSTWDTIEGSTNGVKILLANHGTASEWGGGDSVQIRETGIRLKQRGYRVEIQNMTPECGRCGSSPHFQPCLTLICSASRDMQSSAQTSSSVSDLDQYASYGEAEEHLDYYKRR